MLVYQQKEFLIFVLRSFICGIFLGAVYDVFRILRIFFKITSCPSRSADRLYSVDYPLIGSISTGNVRSKTIGSVMLFVSDVLFSVIAAIAVVLVAFFENDGKIRVECLAITAIGFVIYYVSAGRLVMLFSAYITFAIRLSGAYLRYLLLLPIRLIYGILRKLYVRLYAYVDLRVKHYIITKDSKKYTSYIESMSRKAFLENTSHEASRGKYGTYGTEKKI